MAEGYLEWAGPHLQGTWVDGEALESFILPGWQWRVAEGAFRLPTSAGGHIQQNVFSPFAQQPENMRPRSASFQVVGKSVDLFWKWYELQGRVVDFFGGQWGADSWLIPAAPGTQEVWQLSRRVAWDVVTGVDSSTYPGAANIDGVAQTIDYSPTATNPLVLGNVYLLDRDNSGGEPDAIQTRSAEDIIAGTPTATRLTFRYPALQKIRIVSVDWVVSAQNLLEWSVTFDEVLTGSYVDIAPGPDVILDASAL